MSEPVSADPVRVRRARMERLAARGQRVGYALYGLAVVGFVAGLVAGLSGLVVVVVIGSLLAGSAVLAPAIVLGFAVRAAEREDRQHGR